MKKYADLDREAYEKDFIVGKFNGVQGNAKYGKLAVKKFHEENREWVDQRRKELSGRKGTAHWAESKGVMSPEKVEAMRAKQRLGWSVTKIWKAVIDGSLPLEEAEAMADAGNVAARIALPTIVRCSSVDGNVQELKLLIERVEGLQKQQIEQTTIAATDLSGVPTEILEQLLPYLNKSDA